MRLVIDGGSWGNRRGYGRFTRELVGALTRLRHGHDLHLVLHEAALSFPVPAGMTCTFIRAARPPSAAATADGFRTPRELWAVANAICRARPDAILFPTLYTFVPLPTRRPILVAIHDAIPERFPELIFSDGRGRWLWAIKRTLAVWQARMILTVSAHARNELVEWLRIDPARIRITPEAPASCFAPVLDHERIARARRLAGLDESTRLVVYLGGMSPHKNLPMLVDVVSELSSQRDLADLKLLIIGDYNDRTFSSIYAALRAQVDASASRAVTFSGPLDDEDVAALMSSAAACVLPSLDEGFGLPAIEAAACGAPVIATRDSAVPETLGDGAICVDPSSRDELRAALEHLLLDAAFGKALARRGAERARRLTWDTSAQAVLDVLDELAG